MTIGEGPGQSSDREAAGFSKPTYNQGQLPASNSGTNEPRAASVRPEGTGNTTVTRAIFVRARYFSRLTAHKVISASQADGARESGLTALIWNQVLSYGADAMITVALAGTVFFSAPSAQQRGNVLLYLLMTMAPFALIAPVIGPALDRVQHGRRWTMAGTAFGRAILALVMAQNFTNLLLLFPAALGSLVLSKSYSVIRASAAPRLMPEEMTLVSTNARLSIFGLGAALVGGGLVGVAIKVTSSYPLGLWITAAAFATTGYYAIRLPKVVDSLPPAPRDSESTPRVDKRQPMSVKRRVLEWTRRGFSPRVVLAMQGECAMRWLSGFLVLFLTFYIGTVSHGLEAAASLGGVGAATGIGNFVGTGLGTRLKLRRPDLVILLCTAMAAVTCILATTLFSLPVAIIATLICASGNSLSKLSLDAIIQREVPESLRSSGFARSESFLQLSWVFGATVALLLPSKDGSLGFMVAAGLTTLVAIFIALRERAVRTGRKHP